MTLSVSWMENAACAGHPRPEIFFPSESGKAAVRDAQEALRVCASCPVVALCAQYQQETGSVGVWGSALVATKHARTPQDFRAHRQARCGTRSGYKRHYMKGEKPCDACRAAEVARKSPNGSSRARRWG